MNETMVCVVGNVATQPVCRELSTGSSARFRLAVTSRYWDREKSEWTDGHTNFFTVWARRTPAANVASSVSLGDPVVVQGRREPFGIPGRIRQRTNPFLGRRRSGRTHGSESRSGRFRHAETFERSH